MQNSSKRPQISESWLAQIGGEFEKDYMQELRQFLQSQYALGKTIYPAKAHYFSALNQTPFEKVKVVIIGQDPYHGPQQAHGLCFSVNPGVVTPPSLVNIYKELQGDLGIARANHGYLQSWAEQGVLLLNSVLTVEQSKPGAHQNKGWEVFTDAIIEALNKLERPIVFILWGSYAHKKGKNIDRQKHLVIENVHPSPLSAHRGFFGSKPFSQANAFLEQTGQTAIQWKLPDNSELVRQNSKG